METSLQTNEPRMNKQPMSTTKSMLYFTVATVIIIIGLALFFLTQKSSNLEVNLMEALNHPTNLQYEYIGGTEQILFYYAIGDNEEYLIRVHPNLIVIDSYNITKRPEVAQYFNEHYQLNW